MAARHNVVAQTTPGPYPTLQPTPGSDLVETASVPADGMYTAIVDGKTLVLVHNTHATDPHTVTFNSSLDVPYNRSGDITAYSLAAGKMRFFGPFKLTGWSTGGNLNIDTDDATIKLAVITLP